jgi:hypothetical protein
MFMGYNTDFFGDFTITPALKEEDALYLTKFSETRRMKRDSGILKAMYDEDFGVDGEWFVGGSGMLGQDTDQSVVEYNCPPKTQPGLWCNWMPKENGSKLGWTENEKSYNMYDWLAYLVNNYLAPRGYVLNGFVKAHGEEPGDIWAMEVTDNRMVYLAGEVRYERPLPV